MRIEDEIKGRFRNEYHKGMINLRYTVNRISYEFLQFLKTFSITEPQYNVLRILRGFRNEAPLSVSFIKERMLDKNSDVSRIIERLVAQNLVSRAENVADRRQKAVEITEKGIELLSKIDDCERKSDTVLQNLTLDEVIELNRLLDKIRS